MGYLKNIEFNFLTPYNFHVITNPGTNFPILKEFFSKLIFKNRETLQNLSTPFFTLPEIEDEDHYLKNLQKYSTQLVKNQNNFSFFENCIQKFQTFGFPKLICLHNMKQGTVSEYI